MRKFSKATLIGGIAMAAVVALAIPVNAAITSPAANAVVTGTVTLTDNGAQSAGCVGTFGNSSGSTNMYVDQGAGTAITTAVPAGTPDTGTSTVINLGTASGTGATVSQTGPWVTDNFGNGTYTITSIEKNTKATVIIVTICSSGSTTTARETVRVNNSGSLSYGGVSSAPQGTTLAAKATLTDQSGVAAPVGTPVTFQLGSGTVVNAVTGAGGVATANVPVVGPPTNTTLNVGYAGTFWNATSDPVPFSVTTDPTSAVLSPTTSTDYGQTASFTATVTSTIAGLGTPTGQVTFSEDGTPVPATLVPTSTPGVATATISDSTLNAGSHNIGAVYVGDANFTTSTATAATQVVATAPTTVAIATSVSPSFFGEAITYTATVTATSPGATTGAPVGSIAFSTTPTGGASEPIGGAVTLTASGPNVSTASSTAISLLPANTYSTVATYTPAAPGNFTAGSSNLTQVINQANTSVGVVSTLPAFADFGQSVQFTATVTTGSPGQGSPTGTATFVVDSGTPNQIILGTANLNPAGADASSATSPAISTLTPGSHLITVTYTNTDGNYVSGTTGSVGQFIAPDASTVTVSTVNNANPSVFGQPVAFQASVTLAFTDGGTPTGIVLFFVNPSSPVNCNAAPSSTFEETLVNGVATTPPDSSLPVGANTISACYFSSSSDFGASGTADPQYVQTVKADPTTTTLTSANTPGNESGPTVFGQPVTFTASVAANAPGSGVPTGTITFSDGANVLGTVALSGGTSSDTATLETAALSVGGHAITAVFNPNNVDFVTSQQGINQTVNQDPSATTVTQNGQTVQGQPVTFTATVTSTAPGAGIPTGTVQFEINGANILGGPVTLAPLTDGSGSSATSQAITTLTPGTYEATAIYSGDTNFITSTNSLNQIVNPASTATTLVAAPSPVVFGQPVTLTATVTPTGAGAGLPTGTVDFYDGTTLLGAAPVQVVGGTEQASLPGLALTVGSHSFSAVYLGEFDYAGSTSSTVSEGVSLIGTSTAVVSSLNPSTFGASVTFTATVTPASNAGPGPSGTVTFSDGSTVLGSAPVALVSGKYVATLSETSFAVGTHNISASYSGAPNYSGSSTASALAQIVSKDGSKIAAQAATSANSMTATLTSTQGVPIAGQTLTFTSGSTALCSAVTAANGTATCTATGLTGLTLDLAGSYTVTFAGNASYTGSTATAKAP
ncbi:MAG TPA: Ig-like domain-containing protein [Acidimicrobiales bacterium]|nr:Ig-like domain-containing protein [Acidimicrobiales bacterium]